MRTAVAKCLRALIIGALTTTVLAAQGSVSYIYDELGRLVAVIDPAGASAVYVYDAVGNLLSIERPTSGSVAIFEFTPNSGPVGTVVAVYGTGFSTTPGQNTVTFNGVSATVTSSTATKLVTSVPAGATTGVIAVTTPSGSASSSTSFTVASASGAPSITGFTPAIGVSGAAVTVSGANFDALAANDKLLFNTTYASLTGATTTTLSAPVPAGATSGRLTVKTPSGTAVSTTDFFVPPSPFVSADIEVTDRMTIGSSKSVAITGAGKVALVVFDGTKNQRVSLRMTNVTIGWSTVSIRTPDGAVLASGPAGTSGGFIEPKMLPSTGTYTILVDPDSTNTGNMTLTLYDVPPDVTGTITAGGSAVTVTVTAPGQNAALTFSGTQNQRISLQMTNVTIDWTYVSIRKPDGTNLVGPTGFNTFGGLIDVQTLPVTGTYTIPIDPDWVRTGNMTLTLHDVPADVSGSVTIGGASAPVTVSTPGQNGAITFSGTQGQQVTVRVTGNTFAWVTVRLLKPDQSQLTETSWWSSSFNLATQTLPVTGTYTVKVDPSQANLGTLNISVTSP